MKNSCFICLSITAKNGKLQKRLREMEGKAREIVAFTKQLHMDIISMSAEGNVLAAKWEERGLDVQGMPGIAAKAKRLYPRGSELRKSSSKMLSKGRAMLEMRILKLSRSTLAHSIRMLQLRVHS